jgi:hypothetical protein
MTRHLVRIAAAGTMLLGSLARVPNALAAGSCGSGPEFVGATAGTFAAGSPGQENWHKVRLLGPTTINVYGFIEYNFQVYDATCGTSACVAQTSVSCTVATAQTVNIWVQTWDDSATSYVVTAVPNTVAPSCDTACASIVPGAPVAGVPVVGISTAATRNVVGTLDLYDIPLPGGGSVQNVPCVVLTVDGTPDNPCRDIAQGTFDSNIATLVNQSVDEPGPSGPPLVTVGVCHASVTVLVASTGLQDVPAYMLC